MRFYGSITGTGGGRSAVKRTSEQSARALPVHKRVCGEERSVRSRTGGIRSGDCLFLSGSLYVTAAVLLNCFADCERVQMRSLDARATAWCLEMMLTAMYRLAAIHDEDMVRDFYTITQGFLCFLCC